MDRHQPGSAEKLKATPTNTAVETQSTVHDNTVQTSALAPAEVEAKSVEPSPTANTTETTAAYYVQVGAFKNEVNGDLLQKKVLGLDIAGNAAVTKVYNKGIYRIKLGPYPSRIEADMTANKVRRQLNTSAIVINQ